MIPQQVLEELETLKDTGKYKDAIAIANRYLVKNPGNKEALYQVADIEYRMGKLSKSEKPIDYLIASDPKDAMGWYLKGVLCMEKTEWEEAKKHLKKAVKLLNDENNPEMMRCLALSEYRSGNKEQGLLLMHAAFQENSNDAEIILNLVELYIMQGQLQQARSYIEHYFTHSGDIMFFDKDQSYYDAKLAIFEEYIASHDVLIKKPRSKPTKKKSI
jgi:tetratricopeptide (TPR) repeat protein